MSTPIALITGGTRGIGLGVSRALASAGWNLALGGRRGENDVAGVLAELRGAGVDVRYLQGDLASQDDRRRIVASVRDQIGTVNLLVNNAGRAPRVRADLLEAAEDSFEELIRTNLQGPYFLTQAIANDQIARRRADPSFAAGIIFITSVSAELASTNRGDYCISKAGLSMAAKLFALRLAADGIPVYEVRPGIIATDMTAGVRDVYDRRIADGLVPAGRWGSPDDVGRIVVALARGDLAYATGSVIVVDGGLSVPRL
jgi:NAD(P)-dependent dehydrogenase (short-subunit alcohol dehydrogenase family)